MKRINASLLIGSISMWGWDFHRPLGLVYGLGSYGYVLGMQESEFENVHVMLIDGESWDLIAEYGVENLRDAIWVLSKNWCLVSKNQPIEPYVLADSLVKP